jgi:predicted SpoU family rRNA methylase
MSRLIINTTDEAQLKEIKRILAEKGISFQTEEDYRFEQEMKARKELAGLVESLPKYDITGEEIQSIVEEVRAERYGRKKPDNH